MNPRAPLVAYWHFRSAEISEKQSFLLAEMFSDPESFLEDCKSTLVLYQKLRVVGFVEKASLAIAEVYWSEIAARDLIASEPRAGRLILRQISQSSSTMRY
jgi:hypothetical protein